MSIGAPSSPFISNFIMSNFDAALSEICATMRVTYTRYADDLTFTTNEKSVLFNIPNIVRENLVKFCHKKIKINTSKTVFSSKASNRHITGITVTNDGKLSTGRERKRLVSSMIHRFSNQLLVHDEILKLKGMLAFIMHIEPNFVFRMKKKYSAETIDNLFNYQ
nr:reverse transcriptase domain-containing protein [Undibacterium sp. KW1]